MAEKNGSTRLSAPAAETATSQSGRSQQPISENKPYVANNKTDREREASMDPTRPSDPYAAPRGMLDRSLQAQLGRQLRAIFSDVAQEPVPERFVKLLEALEAREKRR
jgi:hypothetical protein